MQILSACSSNSENQIYSREIIRTDRAPEAVGPYSQAVRTGNTLYLAGQVGLDPETGKFAGNDIRSQSKQALDNLLAILEAAGFDTGDVVDSQVYLADLNDYEIFNEIYSSYFENELPARAVVEVSRLPLDAKVEIKMTAVKR